MYQYQELTPLGFARFRADYDYRFVKASGNAFGYTQILKSFRRSGTDDPITTGGQWWLDGDVAIRVAKWESTGNTVILRQYDSPQFPRKAPTTTVDESFKTYFRFKPAGSDSIWVTLGRVDWSWAATVTFTGSQWEKTSESFGNPVWFEDDSFPKWDGRMIVKP